MMTEHYEKPPIVGQITQRVFIEVCDILDRIYEENRGIGSNDYLSGITDGVIGSLATCMILLLRDARGQSLSKFANLSVEAIQLHRLQARILDSVTGMLDDELHQAEDSPRGPVGHA